MFRSSARLTCGRTKGTSRGRSVATTSSRMSVVRTIWECNFPDSLLDQAARYCITHLDTFNTSTKEGEDSLHLPTEIGEKLFQIAQEEGVDLDDKFTHSF